MGGTWNKEAKLTDINIPALIGMKEQFKNLIIMTDSFTYDQESSIDIFLH